MEGRLLREVFQITNNIISGSVYSPYPRPEEHARMPLPGGTEVEFLLESVCKA